ncbi:MAG: flagellar biosynthetic protein FliR [Planctomycetes bacterium]|nr:flagellar biosynthetic protein FliR [Planctomycetota bacterium]
MDTLALEQLPLLPLVRVLAVATAFPILAGPGTPRMVRLAVSLALALVLVPLPLSRAQAPLSPLATACAVPFEILVGLAIGFAFSLLFHTLAVAGDFLGQEMGLNVASQIDPDSGRPVPLLARLFEMIGLILFVELGGFGLMLRAVRGSFILLPAGAAARPLRMVPPLMEGCGAAVGWGVTVALPAGLVLMVFTVFTTIAARVLPKLHIFYFAYALRMLLAIFLAALLLPRLAPFIARFTEQIFAWVQSGLAPR